MLSAISLVEPSPYDFASMVALPLWFLGGFTVHRSFLLFAVLIISYTIMGFLALIPYGHRRLAIYQYQSAYLTLTALFFALFVADRTEERSEMILSGVTVGALSPRFAGCLAISTSPDSANLLKMGRVRHVQGPQRARLVSDSRRALSFSKSDVRARPSRRRDDRPVAIIVAADFLSFSRGSWGATIVSIALWASCALRRPRTQAETPRYGHGVDRDHDRRAGCSRAVVDGVRTRAFFLQRASVTQEYDEGSTGRFGNQLRFAANAGRALLGVRAAALPRDLRHLETAQFLYRRVRQRRLAGRTPVRSVL